MDKTEIKSSTHISADNVDTSANTQRLTAVYGGQFCRTSGQHVTYSQQQILARGQQSTCSAKLHVQQVKLTQKLKQHSTCLKSSQLSNSHSCLYWQPVYT